MSDSHPVRPVDVLCRRCWSDQVLVTMTATATRYDCEECGQIVTIDRVTNVS